MIQDEKYEFAIAAAMVILDQFDGSPGISRPEQLAIATYSILHAMRRYEEATSRNAIQFSVN